MTQTTKVGIAGYLLLGEVAAAEGVAVGAVKRYNQPFL